MKFDIIISKKRNILLFYCFCGFPIDKWQNIISKIFFIIIIFRNGISFITTRFSKTILSAVNDIIFIRTIIVYTL